MTTTSTLLLEAALAKCCSRPVTVPLERAEADELAALLKAVADPVRLQLVSILRSSPSMSACVCDLTPALGLSQPTVSHHLKVLTEAGVLTRERRGTWAWFTLVPARLDQIARIVA
ncbi:MAG TPA: metalloregulator ArsR/SmtB family transcription factor [Candidatus Lustribacter sp.]|nr:metalloregulator ArsR/SmtB family transcription factor [Candidatus Lustribacter sp.]